MLGDKVLVFPQLCHGRGSCTLMCPGHAISEMPDVIGVLESGSCLSRIAFACGVLNVGEPMATPIIRQLKQWARPQPEQIVISDVSPGTSRPVVEAVRGSDFLLLVTEPRPFGLHALRDGTGRARIEAPDGRGDQAVQCGVHVSGTALVDHRDRYSERLESTGK